MQRMGVKPSGSRDKPGSGLAIMLLLLFLLISILFRWSYVSGYTIASNDGPLGALKTDSHRMPKMFFGGWHDLNSIGLREGAFPNISYDLLWVLGPLGYSKFYAPISLLLLGLSAWTFFRGMRFTPLACILGGLAAMLNSGFFSVACWGI